MLRSQFGPELYRKAIRTYLKRYALGPVETQNLQSVFVELSGQSLDRFFDQWLYHGGLPELKIQYDWQGKEKLAHVTIEQTQQIGDEVLLFQFPTKLRFIAEGKAFDEPIEVTKKRQEFFVRLPTEPQIVRFDPHYSVLSAIDFQLPDKMLIAQLKEENDIIGRLLACDALAKRETKESVAALKETLAGDPHYGVRRAAAAALTKIGTEESVAALAASLGQPDARVRLAIASELANCYRETARQKLLLIVATEKNPAIVAAAVTGLGQYKTDESREAVRKALADDSFNHEPLAAAFTAIRDLGDRELAAELMKTIKDRERELEPQSFTEAFVALAKISQRGSRQREAFDFLSGYLNHPREPLRLAAVRALGELHDVRARSVLESFRDGVGTRLAGAAKAALGQLDKAAPTAPEEVSQLRREVGELRASQEKLQKALDELTSKVEAANGEAKGEPGDK
jgi:aminopeptidase N